MLLVYDTNILSDDYNIDDQYSESIDIPTIIVQKNIGDLFRETIRTKPNEQIILSIKFTGVKLDGNLEMELYFRSDDIKALSFFEEFLSYKEKLSTKFTFTPRYKYIIDVNEKSSNELNGLSMTPCIKSDHFCVSESNTLNISNPRYILLENLRQSCIYIRFSLDEYWNYMVSFNQMCANPNEENFTPKCAEDALKLASLYDKIENIQNCMKSLIIYEAKVEDDYNSFDKKKIYKVPELLINGVKYKGSWYSKYIFNAICTGFIDDDDICKPYNPNLVKRKKNFGIILIIIMGILTIVITLILLFCYRRVINRALENSLNERIKEQAIKKINQYKSLHISSSSNEAEPESNKLELTTSN